MSEVKETSIDLDDENDDDDVVLSTRAKEQHSCPEAEKSANSDEEEKNLPSREQCQALTEEFALVTGTDTALAQFFLQDRQWDLEKSVNAFYESKKGGVKVLQDGDEAELVVTFDSKMVKALENAQVSTVAPTNFKVLSWNIDGLDSNCLKKRTKAVIKTIEQERPDIVFLQEVVPVTYSYMEERLSHYMFIAAGPENYFCTVLLLRTTVYFDGHELISFPSTSMSRNLLSVDAHIGACNLRLMTSHLESMADFSDERKRQLRTAFTRMTSSPSKFNVIFGGDLNLRDREVAAVGLPSRVVDVWEATGKRTSVQHTWDLTRNTNKQMNGKFQPRCRFDRLYLRRQEQAAASSSSEATSGPSMAVARHFGLVGLKKVQGTQYFPSDHWGLLAHFEIVPFV
ncbi:Endonuclease/exonuclease/phosphatase [Trinorchestia longiramus]|nr:Endonuclease/exonuclease/phosphatase [Trinorchestia longiramus]